MVDIQISGVHQFQVSDRIRDYVKDKVGSLEKYTHGVTKAVVTLHEGENKSYRADADMHLAHPHHKTVNAHGNGETIYAAIDGLHDKIAAQLRKLHGKLASHSDRKSAAG